MDKAVPADLGLLLELSRTAYTATFGDTDYKSAEYQDAEQMLTDWHSRADFSDREVISLEQRTSTRSCYPTEQLCRSVTSWTGWTILCRGNLSWSWTTKTNRAPMTHDELQPEISRGFMR